MTFSHIIWSNKTAPGTSLHYVHILNQGAFSKQQFPPHLLVKMYIWFSEIQSSLVREYSVISKFEHWASVSQFYHFHVFCKMFIHKIHCGFFFNCVVNVCVRCRCKVRVEDNMFSYDYPASLIEKDHPTHWLTLEFLSKINWMGSMDLLLEPVLFSICLYVYP